MGKICDRVTLPQLRKFIVQANNKGVSKWASNWYSSVVVQEKTFGIYAIMFCQTFSTFAFAELCFLLSNKSSRASNYEWEMSRFEAYNLRTGFCCLALS